MRHPEMLRLRDSYPAWTTEAIRYADMDAQGHVNNAVYATYFEIGRGRLRRSLKLPPEGSLVVAALSMEFLNEISYPATIEIGTGIASIGMSSFVLGAAIFEDGRCAATARVVWVIRSQSIRRAMPIPPEFEAQLASFRLRPD